MENNIYKSTKIINMKKIYMLLFVLISIQMANAQNNVGIGTNTPDASAKLDITTASDAAGFKKGLLIPKVDLASFTDATPFASLSPAGPASGLIVYSTTSTLSSANDTGFYVNYGTKAFPLWVKLITTLDDKIAWNVVGNYSNGVGTPSTYGTTQISTATGENFCGTILGTDFVIGTNKIERTRFTSDGRIGIGTAAPTANYLMTINATNNTLRGGIDMNLSGMTSTANGINVTTGVSSVNGINVTHSSSATSTSLYGIGGVLSSTNIVSGYNGYRNGSGKSYGIYGITGTVSAYAANTNTWAGFFKGRTLISAADPDGVSLLNSNSDLDVRNTTSGAGNPATLSLRQSTSLPTIGNVLANLDFGDNYVIGAQARIQATRPFAASSAADIPTSLSIFTTADASATMTERMRIGQSGNVAEVWVNTASPYVGDVFISRSDNTGDYAVNGYNRSTTATTGGGIYGECSAAGTTGVWGTNSHASGTGGFFVGQGVTGSSLVAGQGSASTGLSTGGYFRNTSLGTSQAAYFNNGGTICRVDYWNGSTQYKILGTGTVSTTAKDLQGKKVVLHAPETPEIYFQDYGNGKLVNGKARIILDPIMTKNITVNEKHPLQVFIQLNGDCKGVFVTNRTANGFDVTELQGGNSNVEFTWSITANRADEVLDNGNISKNADTRFEDAPGNLEERTPTPKKLKANY